MKAVGINIILTKLDILTDLLNLNTIPIITYLQELMVTIIF